MAYKTTVRTLFGIATTYLMRIEHIDMKWAYLHETIMHNGSETVYAKQYAKFHGTYKHKCNGETNIYGTPTEGYKYPSAVFHLLKKHKFLHSDA